MCDELAYQKLWREESEKAQFYFRRYLARHEEPYERSVLHGLALAYSWAGRQDEAIAVYRQLVATDSTDGAARVGLGRTQLWDNQLRDGYRTLRNVENELHPSEPAWRQSHGFLLQVLDDYTPPLELRVDGSHDSDELDLIRIGANYAFEVEPSLLILAMPSWLHFAQTGYPSGHAWRWQAGLVAPLARNWTVHAYAWLDQYRSSDSTPTAPEGIDWDVPGGDLWFTWIARPRLRFDFGGNSQAIPTVPAFVNEVVLSEATASVDWRLARHWSCGASGGRGYYTDDNDRWRGSARLDWRTEGAVSWRLGAVGTYFDFAIPYPGTGYWSPDWVYNVSLDGSFGARWDRYTARLSARYGREREAGSDGRSVGSVAGRLGWRFAAGALAALDAGYSRSALTSPSGYDRVFAGLSVRIFY
jgi:hypothetical protein